MMQPLHEGREVRRRSKMMRRGGGVEFDGKKQEEDDVMIVMGLQVVGVVMFMKESLECAVNFYRGKRMGEGVVIYVLAFVIEC